MSDTPLLSFFATAPRGVEPLLATEIAGFGAQTTKERKGGIAFTGSLESAYRACLWSRLANRILLPLATFPLTDADSLYAGASTVDWPELFALDKRFAIEVAGRSAAVTHTHYAGLKVKDAIADAFRKRYDERPSVDTESPDISIHVHLDRAQATISLDLSGESLHRRGYRSGAGEAPLKENLAAAILIRAGWPGIAAAGGGLVDPMCGSGTLLLEAALIAADIAPGLKRVKYGFEAWAGHDAELWRKIRAEASGRKSAGLARLPPLAGSDTDAGVLRKAVQNASNAGLADRITFTQLDALDARPVGELPGLLVTNPPYGERMGMESEIIKLYSLFGATLKQHFGGWKAAVFTSRPDLSPRLGLRAHAMHTLFNGAIECKLLQFQMAAREPSLVESALSQPPTGGEDFANRLRKNAKHLGKWARRNGITHYRLYDADLPDYALAVDLYEVTATGGPELHVHVQEYAAPDSIDPAKAEKRLREALAQLQAILAVPAGRIHYKLRKSQRGSAQYGKQDESRDFKTVVEHGCKLWVNFEDYLDTGLFLDHRPIRLRIQKESAGKRFLNLFCYTGSASVHAAVGGAESTTSVDLSNTYLDWADRNLLLNGYDTRSAWGSHRLVRADCLAWLREQAADRKSPRYNLIFCDPPTFSNSKKMDGVLDTQEDHGQMIRDAVALLAPGGRLYFSTNRRRFKLDESLAAEFAVTDISHQTLDEDFKRPPPAHRCWSIERR